jgi:hypothetical protein
VSVTLRAGEGHLDLELSKVYATGTNANWYASYRPTDGTVFMMLASPGGLGELHSVAQLPRVRSVPQARRGRARQPE